MCLLAVKIGETVDRKSGGMYFIFKEEVYFQSLCHRLGYIRSAVIAVCPREYVCD